MNMKKFLLVSAALLLSIMGYAHDFSATYAGQCLYYQITSKAKKTACVTYKGAIAEKNPCEARGMVKIPATINYEGNVYRVTAIGAKAFADAKSLKGIEIPSGVENIGSFAFEGCDSLTNIIFPGNPVSFGQGTFFRCPAIENVTVGSDWKSIDFTMFRWSNRLQEVIIPAKVDKILGLKHLSALHSVTVDRNNAKFSSFEGVLYNKEGSVLYACPRAYKGALHVKPGTVTVREDALIDCSEITSISLPVSLKEISFRETSRMESLSTVSLQNDDPILTGYDGSNGKFFFQLANPDAIIEVPMAARAKYVEMLPSKPGEYSVTIDGIPYYVPQNELPTSKNIKGIKK